MKSLIITILTVILAPIIGCIFTGIERKLSAKLQSRVGPPLLQPLYDLLKLFKKETIVVNHYQNLYALNYLAFITASLVMLVLGMDLLMILFVFTIANIALIIGAAATGSPFSKLGSKREIINMIVYEPILILFIAGVYLTTGSFRIFRVLSFDNPLILSMPLIFISMLIVMLIKFKKSPFDFSGSHEAHQELVRGVLTEFSGPGLALIELAHWYECVFLLGLMFLFFTPNIFAGAAIVLFTFLFVIVVDNVCARVKWQWMLRIVWPVLNVLCIGNLVYLFVLHRTL
jgi:ech hydrogenase subunit B